MECKNASPKFRYLTVGTWYTNTDFGIDVVFSVY